MEMPFTVYQTVIVEQKHGFNKQTAGFFIKDQLKKQAVNSTCFRKQSNKGKANNRSAKLNVYWYAVPLCQQPTWEGSTSH